MSLDPKDTVIHDGMAVRLLELPADHFVLGPHLLARGGLAVMGGLTGIGKTFMLLNLTRALVLGEAPFGCPTWFCAPVKVLYVDKELDPPTLGMRIKPIFQDVDPALVGDRFKIITKPAGVRLTEPRWVNFLRDYCKNEGIDVLVLDPISRLWYDEGQGALAVDTIGEICGARTSAVVTHHFRKPPTGKGADLYNSSDQYNFRGNLGTRLIEDANLSVTFEHKARLPKRSTYHKAWTMAMEIAKVRHEGLDEDVMELAFNANDDRRLLYVPPKLPRKM